MDIENLFWNASIQQMKKGYVYNEKQGKYICLVCGTVFEQGIIYKHEDKFCDARKAIEMHIKEKHNSMMEYLLSMNKKYTGITDIQREYVKLIYQGKNDKEISDIMGVSSSTVRNYRFKLKEKEKQTKVFLSIMELLEEQSEENNDLVKVHRGATMIDERYVVTEKEKKKYINSYFTGEDNKQLKVFPSKEKKKIIVLGIISENFKRNKIYTEKEVNNILKRIYDDYVLIRRYLIEYGFMERKKDGSSYWVR
ncbi:DUF2087 domain-containing protein [Haloimpatiens sp. FM7330]|uniref:DUF2087 domain-containing protein n=1 Tax=Haloimpatiens sp. FM7330 TaxID=3298610 RepID=UPI00362A58EB